DPGLGDRDDRERDQQRTHGHDRRQCEDHLVDEGRIPVFLEEHLQHVGGDLEHTERADAVRTVTVLPPAQQTAFDEAEQRAADHDGEQHHDGLHDSDDRIDHFRGKPRGHCAASCRPS
nr:hypothetical protein [Tanacetum cinerariifolium]